MLSNTTRPDCSEAQLVCWHYLGDVKTFACREAGPDACVVPPDCEHPLKANPDIAGPGVSVMRMSYTIQDADLVGRRVFRCFRLSDVGVDVAFLLASSTEDRTAHQSCQREMEATSVPTISKGYTATYWQRFAYSFRMLLHGHLESERPTASYLPGDFDRRI